MIEAVIFDLDGLLLDTERLALETGVEALAALGHPVPLSVLQGVIGLDDKAGHKLICGWLEKELPYDDIYKPWDDAFLSMMATGIPLRPRVKDTLNLLDDLNFPCAVATNSKTDDALWKLEKAGLEGRFDAVVGRDMAGGSKPLPHVYVFAASLLGKEPSVCLALEDSDVGVRAALAAGMRVVQIPDLVPSQEGAAHHEADSLMAALVWAGITENLVSG
ncbi:HAD family hydrolase [Paracoccus saliphilus]|uniref:HAD family phosphatase n=1 Tax=Paracoccus saliphilus TaxID=405559 RepID=A0AA46A7G0_9RHOB|nr:HAD family phosphatase [Paracoccus saliphilus]WCR04818.1 HAD family phosphatase [Paracoccus saliphilus]SIT12958.1 haloacid dehalogenase superfamily, subfamily IA, variant 3 with third motif having DD or ED [Paracoccus saliphilus]